MNDPTTSTDPDDDRRRAFAAERLAHAPIAAGEQPPTLTTDDIVAAMQAEAEHQLAKSRGEIARLHEVLREEQRRWHGTSKQRVGYDRVNGQRAIADALDTTDPPPPATFRLDESRPPPGWQEAGHGSAHRPSMTKPLDAAWKIYRREGALLVAEASADRGVLAYIDELESNNLALRQDLRRHLSESNVGAREAYHRIREQRGKVDEARELMRSVASDIRRAIRNDAHRSETYGPGHTVILEFCAERLEHSAGVVPGSRVETATDDGALSVPTDETREQRGRELLDGPRGSEGMVGAASLTAGKDRHPDDVAVLEEIARLTGVSRDSTLQGVATLVDRQRDALAQLPKLYASSAADLRAAGWSVAVHNDYRLDGLPYTFWLVVRDGVAIKGEGRYDADALDEIRGQITESSGQIAKPENSADHPGMQSWRCMTCNALAGPRDLLGGRWRWNGERMQHRCGHPQGGHNDAEVVAESSTQRDVSADRRKFALEVDLEEARRDLRQSQEEIVGCVEREKALREEAAGLRERLDRLRDSITLEISRGEARAHHEEVARLYKLLGQLQAPATDALQKLERQLRAAFPALRACAGPTRLDLELDGHVVTVAWTSRDGFGIAARAGDVGYGAVCDETFESDAAALARISGLLRYKEHTRPPLASDEEQAP